MNYSSTKFCTNCGHEVNSFQPSCPNCGAANPAYKPPSYINTPSHAQIAPNRDSDYLGTYKVYKKLPLIYAIIIAVTVFITSLITLIAAGSYADRVFPAVLIMWVLGAVMSLVTYFISKISISATVVLTDTVLSINAKLGASTQTPHAAPTVPTRPIQAAPQAAPAAPPRPAQTAPQAAPVAPPRPVQTAPQTAPTAPQYPSYTPIPNVQKPTLKEKRASRRPSSESRLRFSTLADELCDYHSGFSFTPTSTNEFEQSYVCQHYTPTGASFYQVDTDESNLVKKILIRYKGAPLGIIENEAWMRSCLYKDERALSKTEATAVSLYCDLEILHYLIGSHTGSKEEIEKAVLNNLCYLGTFDPPDWHVSVSADSDTVKIVAERV